MANYTTLRVLISHFIRIVAHSDINRMTVRNIGIVFAPTLGIPAGVFSLFLSEFDYIFFVTDEGLAAPITLEEKSEPDKRETLDLKSGILREKDGRSNRNSLLYQAIVPEMVQREAGLSGTLLEVTKTVITKQESESTEQLPRESIESISSELNNIYEEYMDVESVHSSPPLASREGYQAAHMRLIQTTTVTTMTMQQEFNP